MPKEVIRNLVFQGGGVKGIAYIGALQALEEGGIDLKQIKRVAGTSAGAITAGLLAAGCNLKDMHRLMNAMDFKKFLDDEHWIPTAKGVLKSIAKEEKGKPSFFSSIPAKTKKPLIKYRVKNEDGLYLGGFFRGWLEETIQAQVYALTGGAEHGGDLTFAELHELISKYPEAGFRDLKVFASNLSTKKKEIYCYETYPTMIISDAIRISMSIPMFFVPHQIHCKINGERFISMSDDKRVDGGVYENYAIDCFDDAIYLDEGVSMLEAEDGKAYNPQTLGFRLVSEQSRAYFTAENKERVQLPKQAVEGIGGFVHGIAGAGFSLQDQYYARPEHVERTVYIDHLNISMVAFNLSEEKKALLIHSGDEACKDYMEKQGSFAPKPKDEDEDVAWLCRRSFLMRVEQNNYAIVNIWTSAKNKAIPGVNVGHVSITTPLSHISL